MLIYCRRKHSTEKKKSHWPTSSEPWTCILHGVEAPNIVHTNTLSENLSDIQDKDRYDIVLANPPFGGKERAEVQQNFPIKTGETAFLFLQHFIKILKAGGRAGVVIKNTFLSNTDNASVSLRKLLLESCNLHTVLDLPGGTFTGAGVKTVVLFFEKGAPTQKVWYYQLNLERNLGKTNPLNENDLAEFVELQKTKAESENSWSINNKDVDTSNWDLSVKNPNKKDNTVLREPKEILDEIATLDFESAEILKKGAGAGMKNGWNLKPLSEVCDIKPPKSEARKKIKASELVSFLPMENLGICSKSITLNQDRKLSEVEGSYTYFADEDVLLAKITPCFENGKLGIAKNLTNGIGFGSSEYIVFRPNPMLFNEYLFYFLSQESLRVEGAARMTGAVGHKRIPKDFIELYKIPLPPLTEQKRIVAILDEAFAAIDKAKANAEKNLANAKELFESYLNGVFANPGNDWEKKTLNEISENLDSKRVPITKNVRKEGPIPYYGASGIVDYVADYLFDDDLLCISEDGANLLARNLPNCFFYFRQIMVNNHAHVLKFKNIISQKFIELYLNSIKLNDFVSGMAQPKLNQTMLNKIPIPFPSIGIQEAIVNKLDDLSFETNQLEQIYRQQVTAHDELKKSILKKAFEGKL